jgi:hypothetical protein
VLGAALTLAGVRSLTVAGPGAGVFADNTRYLWPEFNPCQVAFHELV